VQLESFDLSIVALFILLIIFFSAYNRTQIVIISYRIFISLLIASMFMIIIDLLGWIFNGQSGSFNYFANLLFNLILYITVPITGFLWIEYTMHYIQFDQKKMHFYSRFFILLFLVNAIISILSLQYGWFFSVNSATNIYSRGPLFWVHVFINYIQIVFALYILIKHRRILEKKNFYYLLFYYFPIIVGTLIQMFNYGVSYNWVGQTIALLFIYINLQDKEINTDYLTGTYNRRQLESYFHVKIRSASEQKTFGAIMIDLKNFKAINDTHGHTMGDEALKDAVKIMKSTVRKGDFIARFGGDEFIIVLDIAAENHQILDNTVKRIIEEVENFNKTTQQQYTLGFTMGYTIYDFHEKLEAKDFFHRIDELMYKHKNVKV